MVYQKKLELNPKTNKSDHENDSNYNLAVIEEKNKIEFTSISSLSKNFQSFALSQILLLQSRKKWGIVFTLATLVGIGCVVNVNDNTQFITIVQSTIHHGNNLLSLLIVISKITVLPIISFLIIVGMYVFNDLIDADLDRINGKKRPIPLGLVTKKQAWVFIILTNGLGIILSIITLNSNGIIMTSMLVAIGILYSIPKIALKDRFIVKTLSISIAMMLSLMIGSSITVFTPAITYLHNSTNIISTTSLTLYSALMLGIMVFITSPFNDVGDILGDRAAGRKTIPVIIGKENTVKLAILLAASLSIISVTAYSLFPTSIGIYNPIFVSVTSIAIAMTMIQTLKRITEPDIVNRFLKKKTLPLHIILQASLMAGSLSLLFLH